MTQDKKGKTSPNKEKLDKLSLALRKNLMRRKNARNTTNKQ
ncbi:hypothetical protein OAP56_04975 [Rickettsiaceae bacterium]|nr:hypothetical protein [Rickettsiaceae bacterium]